MTTFDQRVEHGVKVNCHNANGVCIRGKTNFYRGHNVLEIVVGNIFIKSNSSCQELRKADVGH